MKFIRLLAAAVLVMWMQQALFAQMTAEDTGGRPRARKVIVTSTGVYQAEVWQASGGGLMAFYNLAADPEKKTNLADHSRGLFEIGWHGQGFKGPDKADCCAKHILAKAKKEGEQCHDGCGDWPSMNHKDLDACGEMEVLEQSPARVRVRVKAPFTWWSKYVHPLEAEAVYTFYPAAQVAIQVRVTNPGDRPFHWSTEFGPHLMVPGDGKNADKDLGFAWSTPKLDAVKGEPSEELILAASGKTKTAFLLAIPAEAGRTFGRWMHHDGRSIGWDRAGYGSNNMTMPPGYDETWACLIQMATPDGKQTPKFMTAADALPFAMQYRAPGKVTAPGVPVTNDPGDFNADGFNESEGCYVLQNLKEDQFVFLSERPVFAPVFKIAGWKDAVPVSARIGTKKVPFVAGLAGDDLIIQLLDTIDLGEYGIGVQRAPKKGEAVFSF